MSNRIRNNLIACLIVALMLIVMVMSSGCANIEYTNGTETLKVTTFLKSVEGFGADRDAEGFTVLIDKTRTNDPLPGLVELLETINELKGMGLSYDPPPND